MKHSSLSTPDIGSENNRRIPKTRGSLAENSNIPRLRIRSSSTERRSRKSALKIIGKPSLSSTPKTPLYSQPNLVGLRCRSSSAERASNFTCKLPRKDSRPITEKAFQIQMMKKIDTFFESIEQSSMLNSNGSIKPLTIKMFVDVSNLLIQFLGVKHFLSNLNYVEEMPKVAKWLNYPGQMSKAWLKTANTMHAFPQALAWMSWLVEINELRDLALKQISLEDLPFSNIDNQGQKNKNMFFAMLDFYSAWNDENLQLEERLLNEYLKAEESCYDVSEEILNRAKLNYEAADEQLGKENKLRLGVDIETKKLQEMLSNFSQDIKNLDEFNLQQSKNIKVMSVEIETMKSEFCIFDKNTKKEFAKQKKLKVLIKNQPVSLKERDEIVNKCEEIKTFLKQFENLLQEIQKDVYSHDMKLSSVNHNLNKIILKYNEYVHKHLDAISGINIIEIQIPENVISSPYAREVLQDISYALTKIKEKMQKEFEETKVLIKRNSNDLEELQENVKILTENEVELIKKLEEKKTKISKIKAYGKTEENKIRENINKLEKKIKSIQDSLPDIESLKKDLKDKTDKRDALKRQFEYLQKRTSKFFENMYGILTTHRQECSNIFNRIKKD